MTSKDGAVTQAVRIAELELALKKSKAYHLQFVAVVVEVMGGELRVSNGDYRKAHGVYLDQTSDPATGDLIYRTYRGPKRNPVEAAVHCTMTEVDRLEALTLESLVEHPDLGTVVGVKDLATGVIFPWYHNEKLLEAFVRFLDDQRLTQRKEPPSGQTT